MRPPSPLSRRAVGSGLDQAWALSGMDPEATATIFATAYHIKVAVADSIRFWLSSGNWNNSNQPAIDPVEAGPESPDAAAARHGDRDWHVIVDHPALAATFEAYLVNDLTVAAAHNAPPEQPGPPLPPPGTGSTTTPAFEEFFGSTTITGTMTLTPLLTPDPGVYVRAVQELITSAQTSLWMQFQYIEPPRTVDATSQPFVDLITAVIDRQNAGVDVRIITSEFQTAGYLEQLQTLGLNVATRHENPEQRPQQRHRRRRHARARVQPELVDRRHPLQPRRRPDHRPPRRRYLLREHLHPRLEPSRPPARS